MNEIETDASIQSAALPTLSKGPIVLAEGKYIRLVRKENGYEYAARCNCNGVVTIIAVTESSELLLTEQYRPALDAVVIDLPAGLCGDGKGNANENPARAASRELEQETGYRANGVQFLFQRPTSPGLSNELVDFYLARDVHYLTDEVGCKEEHEVLNCLKMPLEDARQWLEDRAREGRLIDPKVDVALHTMAQLCPAERTEQQRILEARISGSLLGTALGDALGLPAETLTAAQISEKYGVIEKILAPGDNRFFKGAILPVGTVSDDTQLSIALAKALLTANDFDPEAVAYFHVRAASERTLGWGRTTEEAVQRWARGEPLLRDPELVGDREGYGNGVAMKIAPLAYLAEIQKWNDDRLASAAIQLAKMTHPTVLGAQSALAQVFAVKYCITSTLETFDTAEFLASVNRGLSFLDEKDPSLKATPEYDLKARIELIPNLLTKDPAAVIAAFGGGSCFAFDSIPFALCFFLRKHASAGCLFDVINAGGDTDSNGAMVGALLGALHGPGIFPRELLGQLQDLDNIGQLVQKFVKMES